MRKSQGVYTNAEIVAMVYEYSNKTNVNKNV